MSQTYLLRKIETKQEEQQLGKILTQCFNEPFQDWAFYRDLLGIEKFRFLLINDTIVGGLVIYDMGQWFQEKHFPMAGIASVGIAPEYRGKGAAYQLMTAVLKEIYQRKFPISTLYPATRKLYRKVGYEIAGLSNLLEFPLREIQVKSSSCTVRQIESKPCDLILQMYQKYAQACHGYLNRHEFLWEIIFDNRKSSVYTYLIEDEQNPVGYIVYRVEQFNNEPCLVIQDWVCLTGKAQQKIWSFIAQQNSQIELCHWRGSVLDPRLMLLSELPSHKFRVVKSKFWMLRVVNVPLALEMRHYPLLDRELHLQVEDEILTENQDCFILTVSGGKGTVTQGGKGELKLPIQSLSSLLSGFYSASQLASMGQLEGTESAIATANQLFNSPPPVLVDFF